MSESIQTDVPNGQNLRIAYQTLCTSYNAVDAIRGQLLGFLPLASSGIFVLLTKSEHLSMLRDPKLSLPIGLFGFLIALGLYIFEIYGTRRCTHLIILGQHLEDQLKIEGQFKHRPLGLQALPNADSDGCSTNKRITSNGEEKRKSILGDFLSLINEPMAAGVIYPTVGAGWLYLGLQSIDENSLLAFVLSLLVFCIGFLGSCSYNRWLKCVDVRVKRKAINASSWA
jgi:hypothetical protein